MRNCVQYLSAMAVALCHVLCASAERPVSTADVGIHDWPQWGGNIYRNMVSRETGLPESFSRGTSHGVGQTNIKWSATLGSRTFGSPVVANGRVYIATTGRPDDNKYPNRPSNARGELLCLDEKTGKLLWRMNEADDRTYGIVSTPVVDGNRVYVYGCRGDLLCVDTEGLTNGNDGPFTDEALYYRSKETNAPPVVLDNTDADILWTFSVKTTFGITTHNAYAYAPLVYGDYVFASTGNSAREHFQEPMCPDKPCLMALDKHTGKLIAIEEEKMGAAVIHGQWGTPCIGDVKGRSLLLFPGGNGIVYAFDPVPARKPLSHVGTFAGVWSFDPNYYSQEKHRAAVFGAPICYKDRVYCALSDDWTTHSAKAGVLLCMDASLMGDITRNGLVWKYTDIGISEATVSIDEDLLYITDLRGKVRCIDANSGKPYWIYESGAPIWQSTLVADGKIYFGNSKGDFVILKAGKTLSVLFKTQMKGQMVGACTAANGVLYVVVGPRLYAITAPNKGSH